MKMLKKFPDRVNVFMADLFISIIVEKSAVIETNGWYF